MDDYVLIYWSGRGREWGITRQCVPFRYTRPPDQDLPLGWMNGEEWMDGRVGG